MPVSPSSRGSSEQPLLSASDFAAALALVQRCDAAADIETFQEDVLDLIDLVPGVMSVYNEIDLRSGLTTGSSRPPFDDFERQAGIFNTYMHQHPVIAHMSETGDTAPLAISDCLELPELERLDLYREFFAPLGVVDQIAVGFPSNAELVIGVAISRSSRGFSDRERAILRLLAPYLGAGSLAARARSAAADSSADAPLSRAGAALIVIDEAGVVTSLVGRAAEVCNTYLGAEPRIGGPLDGGLSPLAELPSAVDAGAGELGAAGLRGVAARGDSHLRARVIDGRVPGADRILILVDDPEPVDGSRARRLGLSAREREVANHLARARSNDEMAERLVISPHTVKRHLERVYEKLGVGSRAEAIVALLEAG